MMGWDIDRFPEGEVNLELICCICTSILEDPVESPCRHVFCTKCIKTWLSNQKSCPHCRAPVHNRDLQGVVPLLKSIISKQYCDNREKGCEEVVALDMIQSHVSLCNYGITSFPNDGCGLKILRKDLKTHCELCLKGTVTCDQGCEMFLTLGEKGRSHNCIQALQRHFQDTTNEMLGRISKVEELVKLLVSKTSVVTQRAGTGRFASADLRAHHVSSRNHPEGPSNWAAPYSIPSPQPYTVLADNHNINQEHNEFSDSVESVSSDLFDNVARDTNPILPRDYERSSPQVVERGMSPVFEHQIRDRFSPGQREEKRRTDNRVQRQRSHSLRVTFSRGTASKEYSSQRERRSNRRHRHSNETERPSRYSSTAQNTLDAVEPLVLRNGVSSETVSDTSSSSSSSESEISD